MTEFENIRITDTLWDAIVVGGGPAGCAYVKTARRINPKCQILVLEKHHFPRDKVCGDGLTFLTLPLVRKVFPDVELPLGTACNRVTANVPFGRRLYSLSTPAGTMPRREFDLLLWRSMLATGVDVLEGASVVDVARVGAGAEGQNRVVGVVANINGEQRVFRSNLVVGADGSAGIIRRRTVGVARDHVVRAVRQYVRGIPPVQDGLIFYLDPDGRGYFWVFPFQRSDGWHANLGYGTYETVTPNLRFHYQKWLQDERVRQLIGGGTLYGRLEAFPLHTMAMSGFRMAPAQPFGGPGFVLVGDAAGLIHPYTGEGISFAIESGAEAAEARARCPANEEEALNLYRTSLLHSMAASHESILGWIALRVPQLLPQLIVSSYYPLMTVTVRTIKRILRPIVRHRLKGSKFAGMVYSES